MSEHLPSVRQIDNARIPLRQATDLAIVIDVLGTRAPDDLLNFEIGQFMSNIRCAVSRLGFRLEPMAPVSLVIDNTNHAERRR